MPYPLKPKYIRQFFTSPKRVARDEAEVKIVESQTDSWFADKVSWFLCWMKGWTRIPHRFRDREELRSYLIDAGFSDSDFFIHDSRDDEKWGR